MSNLVRFHRAGAPIGAPSASRRFPHWSNAQGNDMDIVPSPVIMGMRVPLPLTPFPAVLAAAPSATADLVGKPQGAFRPVRLIVGSSADTSGGFGTTVTNIIVGVDTCLAQRGGISAAFFQPTGVELALTLPDAGPTIDVGCTVGNLLATTSNVVGQFLGDFVKGGHLAQVG